MIDIDPKCIRINDIVPGNIIYKHDDFGSNSCTPWFIVSVVNDHPTTRTTMGCVDCYGIFFKVTFDSEVSLYYNGLLNQRLNNIDE